MRRRRYTAHLADLEKAVLYSLSHEVSQHSAVTGEVLAALQDYLHVLARHFPSGRRRRATGNFLEALSDWTDGHEDAVRGEDFAEKVQELRFLTSAFQDLPDEWTGCRGSEAR